MPQLQFRNYEKDKGKQFEGSYTRVSKSLSSLYPRKITYPECLFAGQLYHGHHILYPLRLHDRHQRIRALSERHRANGWLQLIHLVSALGQANVDGVSDECVQCIGSMDSFLCARICWC